MYRQITGQLRPVIIAHNLDRNDVGEVGTSYQLIRAMVDTGEVSPILLVLQNPKREPVSKQFPELEVHTWREPAWLMRFERLNAMAKPAIPWFYRQTRQWIKARIAEGEQFDLIHQILPRAPRYTSRLSGLGVPYVIGPVGGAIPTPKNFKHHKSTDPWFTKLRQLDQYRFRYDVALRRGFAEADLVLGVAPYMQKVMGEMSFRRFEPFLGIGVECLAPSVKRAGTPQVLKLLFVGRAVRTKGLREAILALAQIKNRPKITLTVIGDGPEIDVVRELAAEKGVLDRISFEGRKPRHEIEDYYQSHDVLLFPSFRESMGGVIYEAMRWGMPVITVDYGGPGFIVDESCGLKSPLTEPNELALSLSKHIANLADDLVLRNQLSKGARQRIIKDALWETKARRMLDLYQETVQTHYNQRLSNK
ncbi:glycosyltransferase family 4 protein [uncultured Shimia sp.]|uniref:glycosyltransferase family 4 protein n=1 Tax=uncultured Shimia sp. TaxID=573152 RepID=UPI002621AB76|nr:glycosyltransferase family 4 protein [uncultured Shimia sp.]